MTSLAIEELPAARRVQVLLPLPFDEAFDYTVGDIDLAPGDYVTVPFGRKEAVGVVWSEEASDVPAEKLKLVRARHAGLPPMSAEMRRFLGWVARYTMAPLGQVLKMALPHADTFLPPSPKRYYRWTGKDIAPLTPARRKVVELMRDQISRTLPDILAAARVGEAVVKGLVKAGALHIVEIAAAEGEAAAPVALPEGPALSNAQAQAMETLRAKLGQGHSVTLLDGVTGSGKTEVYFDVIAEALRQGGQALVLLPEIALSVQWLQRFEARFGFSPNVWHSSVALGKKKATWRAVATGQAKVVVGARSALFLPFAQLALVVVDEEHDASYKQEEGVIYHARDMAVARAHIEQVPITLVSATPSLETVANVESGKFGRVHLPERHGAAQLPRILLVDMRTQKTDGFLSPLLRQKLAENFASGRQSMLFLNRRGYAPLVLCRSCGHRFACKECAAWLVLHKKRPRLQCHHCGHTEPLPTLCPACGSEESLAPCGPGVERVAEEAQGLLPQARLSVMSSDALSDPAQLRDTVAAMTEGAIDILIGTQMVAKGHHFPSLALVGVVDGDLGLGGGDLRAGERTYQLLHQLAGRAGRERELGEVYIQSYLPTHPVMQALASGERDAFLQAESRDREDAGMPPFGRLAALIVEGAKEEEVSAYARRLVQSAPRHKDIRVLGPAPAPLALLRGKHRYRLLVKGPKSLALQPFISHWLVDAPAPRHVKLKIDIDPYSFF